MKYENTAKSRSRGRLVVVGHLEKFGVKYRCQKKKRKKKKLIDELLTNSYAANSLLLLLLLLFCLDARFDFRFRFSPGAMEPESRLESGVWPCLIGKLQKDWHIQSLYTEW